MIQLEFYGVLAEAAGRSAMNYPLERAEPLDDVLAHLADELPALSGHLPTTACAVDDAIVARGATIHPGVKLALLPPVSGG